MNYNQRKMYKMRKVSIFCLYLFVLHICCLVRPWGEGCLWLFCWFSFDEVWCSEAAKAGLLNSVQFLYLFVKFSDYRIAFGKIKSDNILWKHRCFWYCARNGSSEPWKFEKKNNCVLFTLSTTATGLCVQFWQM